MKLNNLFKKIEVCGQIAGIPVMIKTYVVNSEIPLVFSKYAMTKANMKCDLEIYKAAIFGKDVILVNSANEQYYIQ